MSEDPTQTASVVTIAGSVTTKKEIIRSLTLPKTALAFRLDELSPGCAYKVEMLAIANYSDKTFVSESRSVKIGTLPEPVFSLELDSASTNTLEVKWETALTPGVKEHFYKLAITGLGIEHSLIVDVPSDQTCHEFFDLPEGYEYNVAVVVVARMGDMEVHSEACSSVFATLPSPPTGLWVSSDSEHLQRAVEWAPSPTATVNSYKLTWRSNDDEGKTHEAFVNSSDKTDDESDARFSHSLGKLVNGNKYSVSVSAIVSFDEGRNVVESKELQEEFVFTEAEGLKVFLLM